MDVFHAIHIVEPFKIGKGTFYRSKHIFIAESTFQFANRHDKTHFKYVLTYFYGSKQFLAFDRKDLMVVRINPRTYQCICEN